MTKIGKTLTQIDLYFQQLEELMAKMAQKIF
jgi:hypothetical protein